MKIATFLGTLFFAYLLHLPHGECQSRFSVDLQSHEIEFAGKQQKAPLFGTSDDWVDYKVEKIGGKEFLTLKIWSSPSGTKAIKQGFFWIVYEPKGNSLKEIARIVLQERTYSTETEFTESKLQTPSIKIEKGKTKFFLDGEETDPQSGS